MTKKNDSEDLKKTIGTVFELDLEKHKQMRIAMAELGLPARSFVKLAVIMYSKQIVDQHNQKIISEKLAIKDN